MAFSSPQDNRYLPEGHSTHHKTIYLPHGHSPHHNIRDINLKGILLITS
jgi:hypothetical protein